jgi:hypothetical protein
MTAGITANALYVSTGATFASLATFSSGLSSDNLYVSGGATFASLATFSSGLSSGSTITVNNAIQVAQPVANTTALVLRTRATNSNSITINATGGNVSVASGTGVLRVTTGFGTGIWSTFGAQRGKLALQGNDNDAATFDVTIDPSTALSASRTLTCPNLSGTLAVVNAAQTFSSLQTFTAGITANALYVSTGATFASRPSFPSGLTTDNLWVTNGATFASRPSFTLGLTTDNLWVTNGATFASNISAPNIVNSFNGATGAVTGVASICGLTGAVGITNGTGIGLSVSGQTMTFSNTGVLSIDGSTGAITNVARTNVDNNFSSAQTIDAPGAFLEIIGSAASFTLTPGVGIAVSDSFSSPQTLQFNQAGTTTTVTLPNYTTTLAGLSGNQTFTALNTFTAGITANALYVSTGATFASRPSFPSGLTTDNLWVTNGVTFAGTSVHTGLGAFNGGITSNNLWVTNGATFSSTAAFTTGITANNLWIGSGATFVGNADFRSGLSADDIWITNGATFASRSSFNAGLTTSNLWVTNGATFAAISAFTSGITANALYVSTGATFASRPSFTAGLTASNLWVSNGATFAAISAFTSGITANNFYVSGGATFAGANLVTFTTGLSAADVRANQVLTDSIFSRTQGSALQINYDANTITTIGDEPGNGNSTYISVDDSTGIITLSAGVGGINNFGGFLNQVSAPSFADSYSYCQTFRATTTATTANQTIATVPSVYDDGEIPPVMLYPAFEVTISARDTVANKTEMLKMLIVQNGTDTVNTQYGLIRTGATGPVSSYSTTLSGSPKDLLIRATPLSANSTVFTTTVRAQSNG